MNERFKQQYGPGGLFRPQQRVLLAVSGGVDSMVMLKLFELNNLRYGVAHVNFMLRGAESDEDARFVEAATQKAGVDFIKKTFDTGSYARQHHLSIQEAARELRYHWFDAMTGGDAFDVYATAHQFDDQVETFFINMIRGTGIAGLRGIPARNGRCIRPLLFATRNEILSFAADHQLAYREDSSNRSDKYLRNRIRHFVLPNLEKADSAFLQGFGRTLGNLTETDHFVKSQIQKISAETVKKDGEYTLISIKKLKAYKPLNFVLFELLRPFGFNAAVVDEVCRSLEATPGKWFYAAGHVLITDREYLVIAPKNVLNDDRVFVINAEGEHPEVPVDLEISRFELGKDFKINTRPMVAQLDASRLQFPLKIRKARPGDAFHPLGMKGRKKLSDFFTDLKLPVHQKMETWLLTSGGEIAWVIGQRIDHRFRITPATTTIVQLTCK